MTASPKRDDHALADQAFDRTVGFGAEIDRALGLRRAERVAHALRERAGLERQRDGAIPPGVEIVHYAGDHNGAAGAIEHADRGARRERGRRRRDPTTKTSPGRPSSTTSYSMWLPR